MQCNIFCHQYQGMQFLSIVVKASNECWKTVQSLHMCKWSGLYEFSSSLLCLLCNNYFRHFLSSNIHRFIFCLPSDRFILLLVVKTVQLNIHCKF